MPLRRKSRKDRRSSGLSGHGSGHQQFDDMRKSVKLSKLDQEKFKIRTINVHDPILNAVNEQQPFEEANEHRHQDSINSLSKIALAPGFKDAFGNPITRPDISNPTRQRDERPMDTIRSFEYAITGDPFYKSNLETPMYGWSVRPNFGLFDNNSPYAQGNPYDRYAGGANNAGANGAAVNASASTAAVPRTVEQPVYQTPKPAEKPQKKKRGLFGRNKNKA